MQVEIAQIVRFVVTTILVMTLIYVFAELTPKIAKYVDKWIASYREAHHPTRDPAYGVRSIYDLPPKEEDEEEEKEDKEEQEKGQTHGKE